MDNPNEISSQKGGYGKEILYPLIYLFILCKEALIANIKKQEREKKLTGLKVSRGNPAISHILFADDSLFFVRLLSQNVMLF